MSAAYISVLRTETAMTQQRFGSSLPLVLSPQSIDLGEACQQPQEFLTASKSAFRACVSTSFTRVIKTTLKPQESNTGNAFPDSVRLLCIRALHLRMGKPETLWCVLSTILAECC
jgi:hypothetical protein